MLAPDLLDILVCPKSKAPLVYFPKGETGDDEAAGFLLCPASRLRYRIDDGVAVLLVEEALELPAPDVERLLATARTLGLSLP
ncbi:MAG: Trm112 family protein [Deltaproteobacteria bacterium]|nr:Trm112 family protein [Deltaproteobacteria bacterium]